MAATDVSVAIDILKRLTDVCDSIGKVERDVHLTLQVTAIGDLPLGVALGTVRSVLSSCILQVTTAWNDVVGHVQRIQGAS